MILESLITDFTSVQEAISMYKPPRRTAMNAGIITCFVYESGHDIRLDL